MRRRHIRTGNGTLTGGTRLPLALARHTRGGGGFGWWCEMKSTRVKGWGLQAREPVRGEPGKFRGPCRDRPRHPALLPSCHALPRPVPAPRGFGVGRAKVSCGTFPTLISFSPQPSRMHTSTGFFCGITGCAASSIATELGVVVCVAAVRRAGGMRWPAVGTSVVPSKAFHQDFSAAHLTRSISRNSCARCRSGNFDLSSSSSSAPLEATSRARPTSPATGALLDGLPDVCATLYTCRTARRPLLDAG